MELNVTKETLSFNKSLLEHSVAFCKALNKEIKRVEKGAPAPAAKKAAKAAPEAEAPKAEKAAPAAKKTAKKTAKKAVKEEKKAPKKAAAPKSERVTLKTRVQAYLAEKHTKSDVWSPKELLKSKELEGTTNVPLNRFPVRFAFGCPTVHRA